MRDFRAWLNLEPENCDAVYEGLIARSLVDAAGELIFRPTEVDQGVFNEWDAGILRGLGELCDQHTGFSASAYDVTQIEAAAKN